MNLHFFALNFSLVGILLSAFLIALTTFFFFNLSKKQNQGWLYILITTAVSLIVLLLFNSRAAFLGCMVNIVYIAKVKGIIRFRKEAILMIGLVCLTIFTSLFFFKVGSSMGRILVYKVTFSQLSLSDYIWGLGLGKFKATYNILQANYFKKNFDNTTEVLLAGSGYYLYNDWLQFALELGLIKVVLIFLIIARISNLLIKKSNNHSVAFRLAQGFLLNISVCALFSYPLQTPLILTIYVIALWRWLYLGYSVRRVNNKKTICHILLFTQGILLLTGLGVAVESIRIARKSTDAYIFLLKGEKNKALKLYEQISSHPLADYNLFYNYAYMFYFRNELDRALYYLDKSLCLVYNQEALKLKADIYAELKLYREAEDCYNQLVYMVPNRMQPRFDLLQYYLKTGDVKKALFWAQSITKMPVKIPSETTQRLIYQAKNVIKQYKHLDIIQ